MHLKLLQKQQFKKTAEANGDFIDNKIAYRVTKVSKIHQRIIQKEMKKKYLEKDLYHQN